jgi:hypothetical protein
MSWSMVAFGLVWVVGGNFLIHLAMKRVHARLRAELAASSITFEEADVRARVTASAMFGFSVNWVRGDLVVHERCAVLYRRNLLIAQPPLVMFRSAADAADLRRWSIGKVVLDADPTFDGESVGLVGKRGMVSWKLRITCAKPLELLRAVTAFRVESPTSAYR